MLFWIIDRTFGRCVVFSCLRIEIIEVELGIWVLSFQFYFTQCVRWQEK